MISDRATALAARLVLASFLALFASPIEATAAGCSQPVSTGAGPIASDCLFILSAAVGLQTCGCECDPNGDTRNTAADALTCLNIAVGVDLPLACPCGGTTSTTNTTVTTSTTTTTTGGGPIDPRDLIGFVTASRDRNIFPASFFGAALAIEESFSLGAGFGIFGDPGDDPNTEVTIEEIAGCTVTTVESVVDFGGGPGVPDVTPLDPGSPGTASNGSVQIELEEMAVGAFAPTEDPYAAGFDGGQTVQFSWPGGSDINAFSNSIAVPPTVEITNPDIAADAFDIVPGQAINVSWIPGPDQDGDITILVSTTTTETIIDGTDVTLETISVTVFCEFADNSGSGTVPSAATSKLQSTAPTFGSLSKSFSAMRQNQKAVSVNAPGVSGPDQVGFFGLSTSTRSITAGFPFP